MYHRALLTSLVLLVAACTPTATPTTTTTVTSTTAPALDPVEARYGYQPGQSVTYDVNVRQDITFDATGDSTDLGDETLPIDADLVSENLGTTTYAPEAVSGSTISLHISASFADTQVRGTVNGDTIDDLADGGVAVDLGRIQPVALTVMVDALGRVLDDGSAAQPMVGADVAALTGITNDLFSVPIGPEFPDRVLTTGDTWQTMSERPGQDGPIPVVGDSRVVDHRDGVLTVETQTTADAYLVDFSREFRDLFLAFSELEGADVPPELTEQLDQIAFRIAVQESVTTETAEFDLDRGLVTKSTKSTNVQLHMEFRAPDEGGEMRSFDIRLDVDQTAVFSLRN